MRRELGNTQVLPDLAAQGARAATALAESLRRTFTAQAQRNAQDLAASVISEREAGRRGRAAGDALNAGLLAAMRELSRRGLLTPELQAQLTAQFENAARPLGRRTAEIIAAEISARNDIANALGDAIDDAAPGLFSRVRSLAQSVGTQLQSFGRTLSFAVTAPIVALGGVSVTAAVRMEKLELGLETITGSAEEAARQLVRLREVAKLPGLSFQEVVRGATNLQVLGFSAQRAEETVRQFGNAVALTGGGGPELDRVITQLVQMASAGRILTQDLRPIIQTAPAVGRALQQAFGTISAEQIEQELARAGVGFEGFLTTVLRELERLPQAAAGLGNSLENLLDDLFFTRAAIGQELAPAVGLLSAQAGELLGWIRDLDPATKQWAISLAAVAAVIGPLAAGVGVLVLALTALGGPVSIALIALTAIVGGLAAAWAKNQLETLAAKQAVDDYLASIERMGASDLDAQFAALTAQRAGVAAEVARLERAVAAGNQRQIGGGLGRQLEAARENLRQIDEAGRRVVQRMIETGQEAESVVAATFAISSELEAEVRLLTEARDLGLLRASDVERAQQLEAQLRAELENGNRSLEDRVRITQLLAQIDLFPLSTTIEQVDAALQGLGVANIVDEVDRVETAMQRLVRATAAWQEQLQRARDQFTAVGGTLDRVTLPVPSDSAPSRQFGESLTEFERRLEAHNRTIAEKEIAAFNERVRAGRELLSAFSDLASVSGELGEAIRGAISGVQAALEGINRINAGRALAATDPTGGALATLSGGITLAAGVIGVFTSALAANAEQERRRTEAIQRSQEAVERFRLELEGFRLDTPGSFEQIGAFASDEAVQAAIREIVGVFEIDGDPRVLSAQGQRRALDELLQSWGLTLEQLTSIADELGVQIFDESGKIVQENFLLLAEASDLARQAMVGFADTLDGIQQERGLRDRVLGIERDPQQQLDALLGDLAAVAPELFDRFLAGVDPTDVEAVRAALLQLLDAFSAGGEEFSALFGDNLSREDFLQWLGLTADSLNAFDQAVNDATSALLNVPQGFRILNLELEKFNAAQAETANSLLGIPSLPSDRPAPFPGIGGIDRPTSGGTVVTDNRVVTINIQQLQGEDGEAFGRRVERIIRDTDRRDSLTFTGLPSRS